MTLVTSVGPGAAAIAGMARLVVLPVRGPQMSTAMSSQDWRSGIPGQPESITGPDGSPRYVAAWCGASGRGDDVRAGEATTDPIDCRTCLRTQPRPIELINASLTGEPTTLPHTGLVVPHTKLRVTDVRHVPGTGGTRARLMLGEHFIGYISSSVHFQPIGRTWIDTTDLAGYAADCRTLAGKTLNVRDVLGTLVREYEAADQRHTIPAAEFDHNECVGCGTAGHDEPCVSTCPFPTGTFGPAVTLRAAASRLTQHPGKAGYLVRSAIRAAARHLTGSPRCYDLAEATISVLADHLAEQADPAFEQLHREGLITWLGRYAPLQTDRLGPDDRARYEDLQRRIAAAARASRHARTDSPANSMRSRSRTAEMTCVESVRCCHPP
ncbi:hypothetical protein [Micromonospora sp. WMMD710]|uniref:hypothetical protein n=1 Tax=Micromonospora sp. WMMD710 TaxID=3016085 RepID=UPI0024175892|nr:hypothetical protein [Micromonospora sp. WMMD710]MDG4759280.1 hypothetical protein [Micromonospora sp. WMMD710]